MNLIKKIFCRTYQTVFRISLPFLPYREPEILESVEEVGVVLKKLGTDSVLLVTDSFLKSTGATERIEKSLNDNGITYTVYDKVMPNPTANNVEDALAVYNESDCRGLIAFGGGSAMDCAKAVGARVVYPKKTLKQLGGILKIFRKLPTLVAIPTTAGTGSEVTLTAVITDSDTKYKYTMNSFPLIPHYAVLDAEVTYTLPPHLTATTGMDALTHAVEAYIGRSTTSQTRALAKEAVKLVFENIETVYADGTNHTARANMLRAAYVAGIAFSKSYVGYIHAVAHSLGGQYNTPHGLANSVLMPVVLDEYGDTVHKKLCELGVVAGICDKTDTDKAGTEKFIRAIKDMNKRLQIPEKLSGIIAADIPIMAKHADKEANPLYPVPKLMSAKELEKLYYKVADWS